MNRLQKKEWIESTNGKVKDAEIVLVAHYRGLNAAEVTDLRMKVRAAGAGFKVTKNLLAKHAIKATAYEKITDLFKGPTAIAYSNDPASAAKVLQEFAKKSGKLTLVGGAIGEKILDQAAIAHLASLPTLDEQRAQLIALLQTPASRIARVLDAYATKDAA
jgi:large subunit ribosomal protein L10